MGRAEAILGVIVVLIGLAAVYRYISLLEEHPEARAGFEVLLAVSIIVLGVFLAVLLYLRRGGVRGVRQQTSPERPSLSTGSNRVGEHSYAPS